MGRQIQAISGCIATTKAAALLATIGSGGNWYDEVNDTIDRYGGQAFHESAIAALPAIHGQTIMVSGDENNRAAYKSVIFIVDDFLGPLGDIVYNGLLAASIAGCTSVTLPPMRMGENEIGIVEMSAARAVHEMVDGVRRFFADTPTSCIETVTFVVENDMATELMLKLALKTH